MLHELTRHWYSKKMHMLTYALLPLSWLFGVIVKIRHWLYRGGIFKSQRFNVPVIVVGNIALGGTGKTPFVLALIELLKAQGYRPGIVSRGVGGIKQHKPRWVMANDAACEVGDEAVLLYQMSAAPLVVGIDRVAAVHELLLNSNCNIVISDDGLQHYRLQRDIEFVIIDGARRFGNHCLLPAGPLREPVTRLAQADFVVVNGGDANDVLTLTLEPTQLVAIAQPERQVKLADFRPTNVHAVAGIGNPERFFTSLKQAGFNLQTHVFPDHHLYQPSDFYFKDKLPIIMTQKDAVKCGAFADENYWYLHVTAKLNTELVHAILLKLKLLEVDHGYEKDFVTNSCRRVKPAQHDDISQ